MSRSIRALLHIWACGAIALGMGGPALAADGRSVQVEGTGTGLGETPIVVIAPNSIHLEGTYVLRPREGGPDLPVTIFKDQGKVFLATVLDRVPAFGSRNYELVEGPNLGGTYRLGVDLKPHEGHQQVAISVAGRPLTTYIPDDGPKPYYFPLIGPTGAAMTRAYPMQQVAGEKVDHPHHRSLWFTHGSVNKVDFWSEAPNHGTIREISRPTIVEGAAIGLIRTTDDWVGPDGKKVCEDERVVRIYATRTARVLDFDVTLKATAGPVTFGDTKEGTFGLRVASSMDLTARQGGRIVNAEGIIDKAAWGQPSPWVDYSGPVDGKMVGIAILNHPESFRYPTTWHVRDYGLFAANPFGWHDFGRKTSGEYVLPAGESIRFRYRVLLHEADAGSASLPAAFSGYGSPPKVTITD